ncbi:hypothetical protein ACIQKB_26155 [Streptomyces sp. NPDC092046]|uniref:hypothetical protein n=1 Tax=Streptomyces sp. NPDC092046 TaxID=3366009 RepID=UPI0037FF5EE0
MRTSLAAEISRVRGGKLVELCAEPFSTADAFTAYCTDARTSEAIAPEPGVAYVAPPRLRA